MKGVDVIALISGVLLTGAAGLSLWLSVVGPVNWRVVQVVAPLLLVVLGVVGLALSRNRQ
jgi:hypothetical protein